MRSGDPCAVVSGRHTLGVVTDTPAAYAVSDLLDILDLSRGGHRANGMGGRLPVRESRGSRYIRHRHATATATATAADLAVEVGSGSRVARVFAGPSQKQRYQRTFGGQLLAQAIIAAGRTVTADPTGAGRPLHSTHTTFLVSGPTPTKSTTSSSRSRTAGPSRPGGVGAADHRHAVGGRDRVVPGGVAGVGPRRADARGAERREPAQRCRGSGRCPRAVCRRLHPRRPHRACGTSKGTFMRGRGRTTSRDRASGCVRGARCPTIRSSTRRSSPTPRTI